MGALQRENIAQAFRKTTRILLCAECGYLLIMTGGFEVLKQEHAPFMGSSPIPQVELLRNILLALAVIGLAVLRLLRLIRSAPAVYWETLVGTLRLEAVRESAFSASIALWGLVVFLVGGRAFDAYLFMGLSAVGFWIHFPRFDRWEQGLSKAKPERDGESELTPSEARGRVFLLTEGRFCRGGRPATLPLSMAMIGELLAVLVIAFVSVFLGFVLYAFLMVES